MNGPNNEDPMSLRIDFDGVVHLCHVSPLYHNRVFSRCYIAFERYDGVAAPDAIVNCLPCVVKELRR